MPLPFSLMDRIDEQQPKAVNSQVTKSYFKSNDGLEELWSELDQWNPDTAEKIDFKEGSAAK